MKDLSPRRCVSILGAQPPGGEQNWNVVCFSLPCSLRMIRNGGASSGEREGGREIFFCRKGGNQFRYLFSFFLEKRGIGRLNSVPIQSIFLFLWGGNGWKPIDSVLWRIIKGIHIFRTRSYISGSHAHQRDSTLLSLDAHLIDRAAERKFTVEINIRGCCQGTIFLGFTRLNE